MLPFGFYGIGMSTVNTNQNIVCGMDSLLISQLNYYVTLCQQEHQSLILPLYSDKLHMGGTIFASFTEIVRQITQ